MTGTIRPLWIQVCAVVFFVELGLLGRSIFFERRLNAEPNQRKNQEKSPYRRNRQKAVLVTGGAGFIGMHTALHLQNKRFSIENTKVIAYDILDEQSTVHDESDYLSYSVELKQERVRELRRGGVTFVRGDVCDSAFLTRTILENNVRSVIHLASRSYTRRDPKDHGNHNAARTVAPVERPFLYPPNNEDCFATLLQVIQQTYNDHGQKIKLVYASSSRGYQFHETVPYAMVEDEVVDPSHIMQPKNNRTAHFRHNEMLARAHHHLYSLPSIGVRFGTVYGPWGRPDFTYYDFARRIYEGRKVFLYNYTRTPRHYLYVDDVVEGIVSSLHLPVAGPQIITLGGGGATAGTEDCPLTDEYLMRLMERTMVEYGHSKADVWVADFGLIDQQEKEYVPYHMGRCKPPDITKSPSYTRRHEQSEALMIGDDEDDEYEESTTIELGIQNFVQWFVDANGHQYSRYIKNDKRVPHLQTFKPKRLSKTRNKSSTKTQTPLNLLCFISSSFGRDAQHVDKIESISEYNHSDPYRYYMFTNLKDLQCDGWHKIVLDKLPYRRLITQSRYPKFLFWQMMMQGTAEVDGFDDLHQCQTIFYSDANLKPRELPEETWQYLALNAKASKAGILEDKRGRESITSELDSFITRKKDLPVNVNASKEWFLSQLGFWDDAHPSYWNMAIVFDPENERMRELTTTFWMHYSLETQSWRDQPLWRHLAHKLQVPIATFPNSTRHRHYWFEKTTNRNFDHRYDSNDN